MSRHRTNFGARGVLYMVLGTVIVVAALITYNHFFPHHFVTPPADIPPEMAQCLQCHKEMAPQEGSYAHAPLSNCSSCHTAHAMGEKAELVKPVDELCLSCHPDQSQGKTSAHAPYRGADCLSCHDAHQSPFPGILASEERELCLSCHSAVESAATPMVHQPFTESCVSCHEPHSSDYETLLFADTPEMCYQCHSETNGDALRPVQHRPFSDGNCLDCHEAHQGEYAALLASSERELCLDCHSQDLNLANPVQHRPFNGDCSQCHQAHASDFAGLLVQQSPSLCYSCHSATRTELVSMTGQHQPFTAGRCLDCHEAHTSPLPGQALLAQSQPGLCYSCHQDILEEQKLSVKHQPFAQGDCISCHKPHAAPAKYMLASDRPNTFCAGSGCHSGVTKSGGHAFDHPLSASQLNCRTCHSEAHAGKNRSLLVATNNALCASCHNDMLTAFLDSSRNLHYGSIQLSKGNRSCTYCHSTAGNEHKACSNAGCHPLKAGSYESGGITYHNHPTGVSGVTCNSCHDFHFGSQQPGDYMLRQDGRDGMCLKCHTLDSLQQY